MDALCASGLPRTVIRPTGYFSFFEEILKQARRGSGVVIGSGEARTNPIHEADLAEVCVRAVDDEAEVVDVGGPEVYTRREIVELAFAALGQRGRIVSLPPSLFRGARALARPLNARLAALLEFGAAVSQVGAVAPAHGGRMLRAHFAALARGDEAGAASSLASPAHIG